MILVEVFKQINEMFNFEKYNYEIRDILLKIREGNYSIDTEPFVNNILLMLDVEIENKSFIEKQSLLKTAITHIGLQQHPTFKELWVARYISELVSFDNLWNKFYLQARGTAVNMRDFEVINRAPEKFFNYGEPKLPQDVVLDAVKTAKRIESANKEDGSFVAMGYYNNDLIVNTPGAFTSEEAVAARNLLLSDSKYQKLLNYIKENPHLTISGEFIHPDFPIVINYKGRKEIVLHMIINKVDGTYLMYSEVQKIAESLGISSVPIEFYDFSCINYTSSKHYQGTDKEGWVCMIEQENGEKLMCKIKVDDYMELHDYISKIMKPKYVLQLILIDKLDDVIAKVQNPFIQSEVLELAISLKNQVIEIKKEIFSEVGNIINAMNFEQFTEYTKVMNDIYNHKTPFAINKVTKNDYKSIIDDVAKQIQHLSEPLEGRSFMRLINSLEVQKYKFSLNDKFEQLFKMRYQEKVKDIIVEFLKGNFTNVNYQKIQIAKEIFKDICKTNPDLIEKMKIYKKQKARWQIYLKSIPESLNNYAKKLEGYNFDIPSLLDKESITTVEETNDLQGKLYTLVMQDLITPKEYAEFAFTQEDLIIFNKQHLNILLNQLNKDYFVDELLVKANITLEKLISDSDLSKNQNQKKLITEVKKIIWNEPLDHNYDVAMEIYKSLDFQQDLIIGYLNNHKTFINALKKTNEVTQYFVREHMETVYQYHDKESFKQMLFNEIEKDKNHVIYDYLLKQLKNKNTEDEEDTEIAI